MSWARRTPPEVRRKAIWEWLLLRHMRFFELREKGSRRVSDQTLSTDLKWLVDRYLIYQLPPSGPGKGGPPYAARTPGGALREHLRDLNAILNDRMLRAWRRETGQPEHEDPDPGCLEDLPPEESPPIAEPGQTTGDFMEWADKRVRLREMWERRVVAETD